MTHVQIRAATKESEPYGDVEYADPGYQDDGKKRYPLDSEAHCRSAWSYINQSGNASKYTAEQLAAIKAKIRAAGKRYGIDFAGKTAAAASLKDVELARPGTWQLSSGEFVCTEQHLIDAARYAAREGARPAPVKLGHVDPRFDGEPALGWLGNYRVEDRDGLVLLADIDGMPDWLGATADTAYPDRSVEGWTDFTDGEETYSFVVDALALLGVTPPGMTSIRSLRDLPQALGVAASARIVARAPSPAPAPPAQTPETSGPATAPADPSTPAEESTVDPAKLREALGLQPDASDDEVKAAVVTAGLAPAPPDPETAPVAASTGGEPRPVVAEGTIVLASSVWADTQKTIETLTAHVAKVQRDERDEVITKAVTAGKFTPAQRVHFTHMWDKDPAATRDLINALTPNRALAVAASGYGDLEADGDADYAALFGAKKAG